MTPSGLTAQSMVGDDEDDDDDMSIASVSDSTYSYEEVLSFNASKPFTECYNDDELFGHEPSTHLKSSTVNGFKGRHGSSLNRGLLNESLRIQVPDNCRRFTDGEVGSKKSAQRTSTPSSATQLQKRIHLQNIDVKSAFLMVSELKSLEISFLIVIACCPMIVGSAQSWK